IKGGSSLADSVRKHPKVFSKLYCNLIELGEASGNLSQVFEDLAIDLKFRRELQSKIISSLTYPIVIFFVCVLSVLFVFNFIIPRMSSMFDGVPNLPWYTSALLASSAWLNQYQGYLILAVILFIAFAIMMLKRPEVKQRIQSVSLNLPLVGGAVL